MLVEGGAVEKDADDRGCTGDSRGLLEEDELTSVLYSMNYTATSNVRREEGVGSIHDRLNWL